MRYLCSVLLLLSSLLCGGCAKGKASAETIVRDAAIKGADKFYNRPLNFDLPAIDSFVGWAYYLANAGGFFIVVGLVLLWWHKDKGIGGRTMLMGVSFGIAAKLVELMGDFIDNYTGMFLFFAIPILLILLFIRYVKIIETILCKFGWCVDLNNDNKYGDIPISPISQRDIETDIIPARGHA